jgi:hypothetical protein
MTYDCKVLVILGGLTALSFIASLAITASIG